MKFIQVRPVTDASVGINLRPAISCTGALPPVFTPRSATGGTRAASGLAADALRARHDPTAADPQAKFVYSENIKLGGYAWIKFC